ncbi:MAG: enoyl-CoA hydratase/isomerase family protein [Pseudomonadota bacterium]
MTPGGTGDIEISARGRAGRITLNRPKALNALTWDMCTAIDAALNDWAARDDIDLLVIDAAGDKAFCAGGDIAQLYDTGRAGDYAYGQAFWRDEYRLNARLAGYSKPSVSFMQGFTMGGGVGIGCHVSHRIVGENSQIAMPECGIGLLPDVGGSRLLAGAPGHLGAYIGITGARMGPGDAIYAGFADAFVPRDDWPAVISALEDSGSVDVIPQATPPGAPLAQAQTRIDALFAPYDLAAILAGLDASGDDLSKAAAKAIRRNSPLAMGAILAILHRWSDGPPPAIETALAQEYRFTWRAMLHGDFLEGIRAQIIDKDRNPNWRDRIDALDPARISAMLADLGPNELTF